MVSSNDRSRRKKSRILEIVLSAGQVTETGKKNNKSGQRRRLCPTGQNSRPPVAREAWGRPAREPPCRASPPVPRPPPGRGKRPLLHLASRPAGRRARRAPFPKRLGIDRTDPFHQRQTARTTTRNAGPRTRHRPRPSRPQANEEPSPCLPSTPSLP